jgi:hypothetical protein
MILRLYRKLRETIGKQEIDGFERVLLARTAQKAGVEQAKVQSLVHEWMEQRPLCAYSSLSLPTRG